MNTPQHPTPLHKNNPGLILLSQGFRPFFLLAGLWSALTMALWIGALQGWLSMPSAFDAVTWHAHEMLFGFVVAAMAGFLLTAIPNWTGRPPLRGAPLGILVIAWLAGRVAVSFSAWCGPLTTAVIDLSFLALFFFMVLREILAGKNWRNLPFPLVLLILFGANALIHWQAITGSPTAAYGLKIAVAMIVLLISLVGGRIIPSFTGNWLRKNDKAHTPASPGKTDAGLIILTASALIAWIIALEHPAASMLLILAGAANIWRLSRWCGLQTLKEPLLWSLHVGFAWIPIGLLLLGLSGLYPNLPTTGGLHALTSGAMGLMTLAVMTRASLGHTGRPLTATGIVTSIYVLVILAAIARVTASFAVFDVTPVLLAAGLCWIAAFGLFAASFGPLLIRR